MDITGYDTVVFSWVSHEAFVTSLVSRIKQIWRGLIIDIELLDSGEKSHGVSLGIEFFNAIRNERHSIIYFFRDAVMKEHLDNHGYTLDFVNEGPFAIHLRKRKSVIFTLLNVAEFASGEKSVGTIDPYEAWLCSPEVLEITLVSPGDPNDNGFSKQILVQIIESCI